MGKILKRAGLGFVLLIAAMMLMVVIMQRMDAQIDYEVSTDGIEIPTFDAIDIPYDQSHDNNTTLPFAASGVIDIDGDGVEELFLGGSRSQPDGIFRFDKGNFTEVSNSGINKENGEASHGSTVLDVDKDGDDDLLVARSDGIWLHLNEGGTFSNQKLDAVMPENTTALGIGVADINRDGHFDMYIGGYIRKDRVEGQNIFNRPGYGGTSQIFLNNGDNTFKNITRESGLEYTHNTFFGIFIDVDEDGFEDLVVVHDTGQVRTWKNNGDLTFANMPNPNSNFNSYPMGIAVGDYDNDGLVDFFFSNVGSTPPNFMIRGDTTEDQQTHWKWMLFRNEGNFTFSDQAEKAKLADYEFSWGAIFEDLNLDGREDLIVSENYVGLPFHNFQFLRSPGRLMIQNANGEFAARGKEAGVVNKRYSIAPVTADFNGDGRPDLVHVNIAGRSQAFLSKPGGGKSLKVKLPNQIESIGAKVTVTTNSGKAYSKWFIRGEGLSSDSSPVLIFGLGEEAAKSVKVRFLSGQESELEGPFADGQVVLKTQTQAGSDKAVNAAE